MFNRETGENVISVPVIRENRYGGDILLIEPIAKANLLMRITPNPLTLK